MIADAELSVRLEPRGVVALAMRAERHLASANALSVGKKGNDPASEKETYASHSRLADAQYFSSIQGMVAHETANGRLPERITFGQLAELKPQWYEIARGHFARIIANHGFRF